MKIRPKHPGAQQFFAEQQVSKSHVRFGSKADIARGQLNVRFTPNSGHWISAARCPLCAKSRHLPFLFDHLVGD